MPELPEAPGGSPTPAVVTKAALNLTGISSLFIASGLRKPAILISSWEAGQRHREQRGSEILRGYLRGQTAGRQACCALRLHSNRESMSGTTTALAVLRALGYRKRKQQLPPIR